MRRLESAAIVGAGRLATGVAYALLRAGMRVVLIAPGALNPGGMRAGVDALLADAVARGLIPPSERDAAQARLMASLRLEDARTAEITIEAVYDDAQIKRDVLARLGNICRPTAIIATTSSTLTVRELCAAAEYPERVVGLHFLFPAGTSRLVEVIAHEGIAPEVVAAATAIVARLGRVPIVVADVAGFVAARLGLAWVNEAARLHEEGVPIATIEEVAHEAFRVEVGPFALMNAVGVASILRMAAGLAERHGRLFVPALSMRRQVASGLPWEIAGGVEATTRDAIVARLWGAALLVAFAVVSDAVASPADVDAAARLALRWGVGPIERARALGHERAAELVASVARRHGMPTPRLLREPSGVAAGRDELE